MRKFISPNCYLEKGYCLVLLVFEEEEEEEEEE